MTIIPFYFTLIHFCLHRTPSDTTCPCTAALCAFRMKEQEKALGGCWIRKEGRTESHLAAELPPWTTTANWPGAEGGLQRRRYAPHFTAPVSSPLHQQSNGKSYHDAFVCQCLMFLTFLRRLCRRQLRAERVVLVPSTPIGLVAQTPTATRTLKHGAPLEHGPALMLAR